MARRPSPLPIGGGTGTPLDLTGTTASADVDFAKPAAQGDVRGPGDARPRGEVIAVDGKTYLKTTLTGPLYQESAAGERHSFDPSTIGEPSSTTSATSCSSPAST